MHKIPGLVFGAVLSLMAAAIPLMAQEAPVGTVTQFDLDNGLQVVVIEDHRVPVVTHMVWYKTGAVDDPLGKSGLAHLLEHLTFKSCAIVRQERKETFAQRISSLGAIDNATTHHDTTHYFQRAARERLRDLMDLEAVRMSGLVVPDDEILTERDVVRAERRSNVEADAIKLLSERLSATLYHNQGYGRPPIGWAHEIVQLTPEDARAAYDRFYTPGNAIVVVAGDVTPDEVKTLAQEIYGRIPARGGAPERRAIAEPDHLTERRVRLVDPRAPQPALFRSYLAPSYASAAPGEAESLEVLANILGRGETSRLNTALVTEDQLAIAAGARFTGENRDSGRFTVFLIARSADGLDEAETKLDAVLAEIIANGVSDAELDRAKTAIEASLIIESDNQQSLAERYGRALAVGRTVEDVQALPERIQRVTKADVQQAAEAFLLKKRSATGILEKGNNGEPSQ